MALVSHMIKNINDNYGTIDDNKKAIRFSEPHYGGVIYFKNGEKISKQKLFEKKEDRGFKDLMSKALGFSYDDQYTTIYFGALQDDVCSLETGKSKCSVTGNILNWEDMKDSAVFKVAVMPLVEREVKKICKKNGTPLAKFGIHYQHAEQNIRAKTNEFCDMKQTKNTEQMRQPGREVKQ